MRYPQPKQLFLNKTSNLKYKIYLGILSSFVIFFSPIVAQEFKIDLSVSDGDTIRMPIDAKVDFKIQLINKLPSENYTIVIKQKSNPLLPIILPLELTLPVNNKGFAPGFIPCGELDSIQYILASLQSESKLSRALNSINNIIKGLKKEIKEKGKSKNDCTNFHVLKIKNLLNSTITTLNSIKVERNQQVEINISRKDGEKTKRWVYILETPRLGEWNVGYGFTFITQIFSKEGRYFLMQQDSVFAIRKNISNKIADFIPTIMFFWTPTKWSNNTWSRSLLGGISFNLERPTILLGVSFSYNRNLNINFGIAAHAQNQLNGRYEEKQILKEVVSEDQLHEKLYRFNPFVSVTYRFNDNPFKSK